MTLAEVQVKWSVILMDRLGPDNSSTLQIIGHVLHRAHAHWNVLGWSLAWNALLTKKLPVLLSRLNEIKWDCEKILPVSGSFWSNLKFFNEWILRRGCEGLMWGWMEFYYNYFPLETFLVLTADQYVGLDNGLLKQQRQDSHVCRGDRTFPPILRKNQSPHYKGDEV